MFFKNMNMFLKKMNMFWKVLERLPVAPDGLVDDDSKNTVYSSRNVWKFVNFA